MTSEQTETKLRLAERFFSLGLDVGFESVIEGPVVTVYRWRPKGRTRVLHIEALAADFAVATGSQAVVVKRLPGETSVGIFVPNRERKLVHFRDTMAETWKIERLGCRIPLALGIDFMGNFVIEDLTAMPHLLIAGCTGSGKSTLLNALVATSIYLMNTSELGLVISDTKGVEFTRFVNAPHLVFPPATTVYQTCEAMDWLIGETERRLGLFAKASVRNIHDFRLLPGTQVKPLPFIVFIIDEVADILTDRTRDKVQKTSVGKLAATQLARIVSKSRASGIYCIAGTQRPSVDVIGGVIKANFPARIAMRVVSQVDSRTILDQGGAEQLLSQGDMLFLNPNKPGLQRVHAPWTPNEDIDACVKFACESRT